MKLVKQQKVCSYMADQNANLSIIGIFQLIEDSVTELMGIQKIDGISTKKNYNAFWAFIKNRVRIIKSIEWGKDISVMSYISKITPAKLYIDIKIQDKEKSDVAVARVELCAIDLETGKIRKTSTVGIDDKIKVEETDFEINYNRFDNLIMPLHETIKVRSSNIDTWHHTNNIEYLRFVINTYNVSELVSLNAKEIEVVYANQSYENELLDIYKLRNENSDIIVIKKDNLDIFKCEITH